MKNIIVISMILCVLISVTRAEIPTMDSALFEYYYEGGPITISGTTASDFGNTGFAGGMNGSTLTSNGDVLSVSTTAGSILYLQNPTWVAYCTKAQGWTLEMKTKINSAVPAGGGALYFSISAGDATKHDIFIWMADRIRTTFTDGWGLMDTTDRFHVYRMGQEANSNIITVWIDGVLSYEYDISSISGYSGVDIWWSDGSGSTGGAYELDYMRFTFNGLYAPQPPFVISETDNQTVVYEQGETQDTYTIQPSGVPQSTITLTISPSTTDVRLNDGAPGANLILAFTPSNYSAQTVTVKAIDDAVKQTIAPRQCHLRHPSVSSESFYNTSDIRDVIALVYDNDVVCGDPGTYYWAADLNKDCKVDFQDFVIISEQWFKCTLPHDPLNCPGPQ